MKKIMLIICAFLTFTANVYANEKETVKFKKCVDGDTAVFTVNNEDIKVRFLAIDTPETVHPTKKEQPYGKNASEYTCKKITNAKKIELEYDSKSTKLDKYERTLAWVWVDNSLFQKELLEIGYAQIKYVYGKYSYLDELEKIEEEAKNEKKGLWKDYTAKTYIVTFIEDNDETKVKVNENELVTPLSVSKEGYNFEGWYLNDKEFDFDTKITSNLTLTAKYNKKIGWTEIAIVLVGAVILYKVNPKKLKKEVKKIMK